MKKLFSRLLEIGLLCAVLTLAALNLADTGPAAPADGSAMTTDRRNKNADEPASAIDVPKPAEEAAAVTGGMTAGSPVPDVAPARIAALFGWRPKAVLAPPEPEPVPEQVQEPEPAIVPEPEPEPLPSVVTEADWLVFVGKVADGEGRYRFFFKNSKTGRLERASEDGTLDWKILEREKNRLTLEKGGERFHAEVR